MLNIYVKIFLITINIGHFSNKMSFSLSKRIYLKMSICMCLYEAAKPKGNPVVVTIRF